MGRQGGGGYRAGTEKRWDASPINSRYFTEIWEKAIREEEIFGIVVAWVFALMGSLILVLGIFSGILGR
jgi:hypothetical protein